MLSDAGALLLLPNTLGEEASPSSCFPADIASAVRGLQGLMAESERGGRRFLGRFLEAPEARRIPIAVVDHKTAVADLDFYLEPILGGERWGYVSDSGLPCLADPGAALVYRAHQRKIHVEAFVGPSSLFLGLMLSGLPAQRFSFRGYLPREEGERTQAIAALERRSGVESETALFIEAPYRNQHLFEALLKALAPTTLLAIASDLTLPTQSAMTKSVAVWRAAPRPELADKPTLFCLYAGKER